MWRMLLCVNYRFNSACPVLLLNFAEELSEEEDEDEVKAAKSTTKTFTKSRSKVQKR